MSTTPNIETAKLIRTYAQSLLDDCTGQDEDAPPLVLAILNTKADDAEACCHMGRALLCIHDGLSDAPSRIGGPMCDLSVTVIAARLGMTSDQPASQPDKIKLFEVSIWYDDSTTYQACVVVSADDTDGAASKVKAMSEAGEVTFAATGSHRGGYGFEVKAPSGGVTSWQEDD